MTESEIAWLAGLLEGEGSFIVCYSRYKDKRYTYARITMQMSDKDVVERVVQLTGTKCKLFTDKILSDVKRGINGTKPLHRVWINGSAAVALMQKLRPWMGIRRRQQIDVAIAAHQCSAPTEGEKLAQRESARLKGVNAQWGSLSPAQRSEKMRVIRAHRTQKWQPRPI